MITERWPSKHVLEHFLLHFWIYKPCGQNRLNKIAKERGFFFLFSDSFPWGEIPSEIKSTILKFDFKIEF